MKKKVWSLFFALLFVLPLCAQKHEVGVGVSGMTGYADRKENNTVMDGGFRVGSYYRYTPIKWIGLESGLYYQFCDENKHRMKNAQALKHAFVLPLKAVVFPHSLFSLTGGVYMKHLFGKAVIIGGMRMEGPELVREFYELKKRPVMGYEVGAALNRKHWRLEVAFKRDIGSWMTEEGFRIAEVHGSYRYTVRPKNTMVHVTVEVPLWRGKK